MTVKLTKNALKEEKAKLNQLSRFLPTLKLKKSLLQMEVALAEKAYLQAHENYNAVKESLKPVLSLLTLDAGFDYVKALEVISIKTGYQNIAGIEVPFLDEVEFIPLNYSLLETPAWLDKTLELLRDLKKEYLKINTARQRKDILEKELRAVSIRVNLFEKILIPRAEDNVRKIKIYLGDVELSQVSRAKVAKSLIEKRLCA